MAAITYPSALPVPADYPFSARDRRASSPQPGLTQHRARAREQITDAKGVRWVYTPAQMHAWRTWYEDTLLNGQLWFAVSLPGDGGWQTRVARYVSGTVRDAEGAGFFTVTADLEVNGSRAAPQTYIPDSFYCYETLFPSILDPNLPSLLACYHTPEDAAEADCVYLSIGYPYAPGFTVESVTGTGLDAVAMIRQQLAPGFAVTNPYYFDRREP